MKIGLTTDWHFCQFSSIVRKMGDRYSIRLEHLIDSINWAENLFSSRGCYAHICLGDAFDKPELNAVEISALNEIRWGKLLHYFIVGNHEMASQDLSTNSANLFDMLPNCNVISTPTMLFGNIFILPYILERNRKPLSEYFEIYGKKPRVILSHNDIAGIQMGSFLSNVGFQVDEIENSCNIFLNGHMHNEGQFASNGWNIGNLCGQNFGEDASLHRHCARILDMDTGEIEVFENPHAINFYKLDFYSNNLDPTDVCNGLKENAVCTIKCSDENFDSVKRTLDECKKIMESKYIVVNSFNGESMSSDKSLSVDHLELFRSYVKENIGCSELILSELREVLK